MAESKTWQSIFSKFPEPNIAITLGILITAGSGIKKHNPFEREDQVSERLLLLIKQNQQFKDSNLIIDSQFNVHDPDDLDPRLRGIPDLTFRILKTKKPLPHFAIEAKRLRYHSPNGDFKTGNSEYVTHRQGMRCFTEDRYAEGLDAGAMLGYVYDGDIASAKAGISKLIQANTSLLKSKIPTGLNPSPILNSSAGVDQTIHTLTGRDFRIFHIFLAV